MDIKIKEAFSFNKKQIEAIAGIHPDLGRYLAAEAFFAGSVAARMAATHAPKKTYTFNKMPPDTVLKINPAARMPSVGSKIYTATMTAVEKFQDREFCYEDLCDLVKAHPEWPTPTASHLKHKGIVVLA